MRARTWRSRALAVACGLVVAAIVVRCGGGGGGGGGNMQPADRVSRLEIGGVPQGGIDLGVGASSVVSVEAFDARGDEVEDAPITASSSNTAVATVAQGISTSRVQLATVDFTIRGVGAGDASVTFRHAPTNTTENVAVRVAPAPPGPPPPPGPAWGAGAQIQIPFTPHTLSIQAVNTNTASIQGSSRGSGPDFTLGFEFTIPITLARYFGGRAAPRPGEPGQAPAAAPGAEAAPTNAAPDGAANTVEVRLESVAFSPSELRVKAGARVRWVNADPVRHSITAFDGSFDSGLIDPGMSYERTFDQAGTFAYHCTPHPFMRGTVIVE